MDGIVTRVLGLPLPGGRGPVQAFRWVSGTVLPRRAHARWLIGAAAEKLSAPAQTRARRNAAQATAQLAELRAAGRRHAWPGVYFDPGYSEAPRPARGAGSAP